MKKEMILGVVFIGVVGLLQPVAVNANDIGESMAYVTIKPSPLPTGELKFTDIKTNAHITFEDTTIKGTDQTAGEKVRGAAKVKIADTRSGIVAGKTGAYTVTIKDVTPTNEALSFINNNLKLNISSSDNGKGVHTHNNIIVGSDEQTVFTGVYEAGVTNREVVLNPTLDIPSTLASSGEYFSKLEWTLIPEV